MAEKTLIRVAAVQIAPDLDTPGGDCDQSSRRARGGC